MKKVAGRWCGKMARGLASLLQVGGSHQRTGTQKPLALGGEWTVGAKGGWWMQVSSWELLQ